MLLLVAVGHFQSNGRKWTEDEEQPDEESNEPTETAMRRREGGGGGDGVGRGVEVKGRMGVK